MSIIISINSELSKQDIVNIFTVVQADRFICLFGQ